MIDALNKLDNRYLFFALVVMLVIFDVFTHSGAISDLSKILVTAYGTYMMTGATTAPSGVEGK